MKSKQLNPKAIVVDFISLCVVIIASFIVYWAINHDKTATIRILVAPTEATVKIGENTYSTDEIIKVKPGTYPVSITTEKVSGDYTFENYSTEIEAKDGETTKLFVVLSETSNKNFYAANEKEGQRLEEIEGNRAKDAQENYINRDPIFAITPFRNYNDGYFVIPTLNEDNSITITISLLSCVQMYRDEAQSAATAWLQNNNIDISKYEITYKNACED